MIAVIQRVKSAQVSVHQKAVAEIQIGILTLLGVEKGDTPQRLQKLIQKICDLRIFEDENGKMNRSLVEIQGEHLIVSQFTLASDCSSGRRPSFLSAEKPELAEGLYRQAIELSRSFGVKTASGIFGADMQVSLVNDGPATFILRSDS
ncbi:MAG: D-aminoacyl-tRNA deacylase [Bdellovibrionia bacterium]